MKTKHNTSTFLQPQVSKKSNQKLPSFARAKNMQNYLNISNHVSSQVSSWNSKQHSYIKPAYNTIRLICCMYLNFENCADTNPNSGQAGVLSSLISQSREQNMLNTLNRKQNPKQDNTINTRTSHYYLTRVIYKINQNGLNLWVVTIKPS